MNTDDPKTGADPAGATGGDPAATNPQATAAATDDQTVTLNKDDYNNLIAQRDRANNAKSELDDTVLTLAQEREIRLKQEFVSDFIEKNKETYPDIEVDDLMAAESPEELEELAKKRQRRYEDVVQAKLLKVQRAGDPVLSPEEKAAELERLQKNPGSSSFSRMIDLQSQ